MTWVLLVLWVFTVLLLIGSSLMVAEVRKEVLTEKSKSHAVCVASIFAVVGEAHAASVLREAADSWDSIEEQANMGRLANEKYQIGGPSMPTIWLRDRAERLSPKTEEVDA